MDTATGDSTNEDRAIEVTGTGLSTAVPDIAAFTIGVQVMQPNVGAATRQSAALTSNVIEVLASFDIAPADVRTTDYNLHAEHDHRGNRPGPAPIIGYRVSNNLQVTVRAVDRLSEIIDAATDAAGSGAGVHGLHFTVSDPQQAEAQAREAAWTDAQAKASQIATLAGVALGPVVSVRETGAGHGPPMPMRHSRMAAMETSAPPPMEAGSSTIAVNLTVVFAIKSS